MWEDRHVAMQLQEQERIQTALDIPKEKMTSLEVASPSLELSDPTPNVFELFAQFNQKFFWGQLAAVSVRWSKKMYSCAGVCRYKGREGFCEIALSEPLLKLRSRKNLVETLLHEMIHAYLFITDNDRDRDGHGPKFHQHMYRINREANVNITVYHNFVDEVQLYQTHWWRCDGPCRNFKPYFGIVRRTCNRAPGPNDFWWTRHLRSCGGKFIKIKEPEKKPVKKSSTPVKGSPIKNKDIRNFFKVTSKVPSKNKQIGKLPKRTKLDISNPISKFSINDDNDNENLKEVMKKPSIPVSGPSISVPGPSKNTVLETVRNHWSNKFNNSSNTNENNSCEDLLTTSKTLSEFNMIIQEVYGKDISLTPDNFKPKMRKRILDEIQETSFSECPVCEKLIYKIDIENHISNCIEHSMINVDQNFSAAKVETLDLTNIGESPIISISEIDCPVCNKKICNDLLEEHLESCLDGTFEDDNDFIESKFNSDGISEDNTVKNFNDNNSNSNHYESKIQVPCPCCLNLIEESEINSHLDLCLN